MRFRVLDLGLTPANKFMSVDFPAPLGPMIPTFGGRGGFRV